MSTAEYYRNYRLLHRDKLRANKRRYYRQRTEEHREKNRAYRLRRSFGLSVEDYEKLVERQGGVCAICRNACGTGQRLAVDHDHETGRVRGLCCYSCNTKLGWYEKWHTEVDAYLQPTP